MVSAGSYLDSLHHMAKWDLQVQGLSCSSAAVLQFLTHQKLNYYHNINRISL
jgi:hypothetical protein